ncbi:MAG: UDP-N-acetylmuramate dehydrogenase [Clostridia bacterium]|nr:UDP-N-acetylmuramate dehydrogenase [Clostridia bacterium]
MSVRVNEPMKNHTSFKVGGYADILVMPGSIEKIAEVLKICSEKEIPYFIMGNGSNLVVRDKGIRGVVIKLFDNLSSFEVKDEMIEADAGILLSKISNVALRHSLAGLEFASGIPGTLGGAVAMNAGAYGGEMKEVVVKSFCMDQTGKMIVIEGDEHRFGYRTSRIQKEGLLVLKSVMQLRKGDPNQIKALMDDLNRRRKEKQPLHLPSAGSVFKRPEGYFAGKLIEDCGLRGFSIGDAEVSDMHCGFIVNKGNASAQDIINLVHHIQSEVNSKYGVTLQTEVRIVGEE